MSPAIIQGIQNESALLGEKVLVRFYAFVDLAESGISLDEG